MADPLLEVRAAGLWCPPAKAWIDPTRAVGRAIVTHGHGDHCRPGSRALLATPETAAIARTRYGKEAFAKVETLAYGEVRELGAARVWLAPAGHVLGSAQVVIEAGGRRAVVSGDYKRMPDPTAAPFEPVPCDLFVTEATFGLPVFRHPPVDVEIARLLASLAAEPGRAHVLGVYALGKAQRMIAELRRAGWDRPVFLHGSLVALCRLYERLGVPLGPLAEVKGTAKEALAGQIVLAPTGALTDRWARRLPEPKPVGVSGWMQVRQRAKQRGVELPLVISDHADWDGLTATIREVEAEEVWVTHGAEEALCHWCAGEGIRAAPLAIAGRSDGGEEA